MSKMQVDLDLISKEDTFSVASSLLYSLKGSPQYSVISELPYILDYSNFIKFIRYYGGKTIRVPTLEEISDVFKVLLLYQNKYIKGMSWNDALLSSGYSEDESISAKAKLSHFVNLLSEINIGAQNYD